jgi:hypothetical protein
MPLKVTVKESPEYKVWMEVFTLAIRALIQISAAVATLGGCISAKMMVDEIKEIANFDLIGA